MDSQDARPAELPVYDPPSIAMKAYFERMQAWQADPAKHPPLLHVGESEETSGIQWLLEAARLDANGLTLTLYPWDLGNDRMQLQLRFACAPPPADALALAAALAPWSARVEQTVRLWFHRGQAPGELVLDGVGGAPVDGFTERPLID